MLEPVEPSRHRSAVVTLFRRHSIVAATAAAGGLAAMIWLEPGFQKPDATGTDSFWMVELAGALALLSLVLGYFAPAGRWVWPLVGAYSFYFCGFFFVEHWGQLLPFELVLMLLLALPGVAACTLGASFRRRASVTAVE